MPFIHEGVVFFSRCFGGQYKVYEKSARTLCMLKVVEHHRLTTHE